MTAPSFVSSSGNVYTQTTPLTLSLPGSLAAGDTLIACIGGTAPTSISLTTPSGWSVLSGPDGSSTTAKSWLLARNAKATAGETGTQNFAIALSGTGAVIGGTMIAVRGCDPTTLMDAAWATLSQGTGTAVGHPATTTATLDSLVLNLAVTTAATAAPGSFGAATGGTWTRNTSGRTLTGNAVAFTLHTAPMAALGTISGASWTSAVSGTWVSRCIVLRPASSDASPITGPTRQIVPITFTTVRTVTTPAFTPIPGDLLTVGATARQNSGGATVPDFSLAHTFGGTWAWTRFQVSGGVSPETINVVFVAMVPVGAGTGTITLDSNVLSGALLTRGRLTVESWSGAVGVPTNYAVGAVAGPTPSLALPSPPRTSSCITGFVAQPGATAPIIDPGSAFIEFDEIGEAAATSYEQQLKRATTLQTLDWANTGNTTPAAIIVFEVASTAAPNVYTMPAAPAAYAWGVQPAGLQLAHRLVAAAGSYAWGVQPAGLRAGRGLKAIPAVYNWSAPPAGLVASRRLPAAAGAFSWAGVPAGLRYARGLAAAPGAFSWAGVAAGLVAARRLAAAAAAFVDTPYPAGLIVGHGIKAVTGSFALAGVNVGLRASRKMPVVAAAYVVAPQTSRVLVGRRLAAASGAFLWTGVSAGAIAHRKLFIANAVFTVIPSVTGAKLVYNRRFGVASAAFVLTASPVNFARQRRVVAVAAAFAVAPQPTRLAWGRILRTTPAAYLWAGFDIAFHVPRKMIAEPASFLVQPVPIRFGRGVLMRAAPASFVIKGVNVTFGEPGVEMLALIEGAIRPDIDGQLQLKLFSKTAGTIWIKVPTVGFLFEVD